MDPTSADASDDRSLQAAHRLLSGEHDWIEAVRAIHAESAVLWVGPVDRSALSVIFDVSRESYQFPTGPTRELWNEEALARLDSERDFYHEEIQDALLAACRELVAALDESGSSRKVSAESSRLISTFHQPDAVESRGPLRDLLFEPLKVALIVISVVLGIAGLAWFGGQSHDDGTTSDSGRQIRLELCTRDAARSYEERFGYFPDAAVLDGIVRFCADSTD